MEFDHVGIVTDQKRGEEDWVEATRVWVTNPKNHPYNIEWLRYEPDTPVTGPVREGPHVAYRVEDIEEEVRTRRLAVLLPPFDVGEFVRVGFYQYEDGTVLELMQYLKGENEWFDKS